MNPDLHFPAIANHMTIARAACVRDLRLMGHTLSSLAAIVHDEWAAEAEAAGEEYVPLWEPPTNQLAGMDLCRAAGITA